MQHEYLFLECLRNNTENGHTASETTHKNVIAFANTVGPNKMSRSSLPTVDSILSYHPISCWSALFLRLSAAFSMHMALVRAITWRRTTYKVAMSTNDETLNGPANKN